MPRPPCTKILFAPLAALAFVTQSGQASIVNPSFEDTTAHPLTDFFRVPTGWTIDTWLFSEEPTSGATDGWPFVTRPTHGQSMGISAGGFLTQSVLLQAGDEVLVDVAIETDRFQSDGLAYIALVAPQMTLSTGIDVPWLSFGLGGTTSRIDWQTLSLVVPTAGTYELRLHGYFGGTGDGWTWAFFDNIRVVPAPGAAVVLGLAGVLISRRRR
jgi:hypothetical protein